MLKLFFDVCEKHNVSRVVFEQVSKMATTHDFGSVFIFSGKQKNDMRKILNNKRFNFKVLSCLVTL